VPLDITVLHAQRAGRARRQSSGSVRSNAHRVGATRGRRHHQRRSGVRRLRRPPHLVTRARAIALVGNMSLFVARLTSSTRSSLSNLSS
jgi:hypothetical protein